MIIEGKTYLKRTPAIMKNAGLGLTPEDRKTTGLILKHSIESNLCYAGMKKTTVNGWWRAGRSARKCPSVRSRHCRSSFPGISCQGKLHVRR